MGDGQVTVEDVFLAKIFDRYALSSLEHSGIKSLNRDMTGRQDWCLLSEMDREVDCCFEACLSMFRAYNILHRRYSSAEYAH